MGPHKGFLYYWAAQRIFYYWVAQRISLLLGRAKDFFIIGPHKAFVYYGAAQRISLLLGRTEDFFTMGPHTAFLYYWAAQTAPIAGEPGNVPGKQCASKETIKKQMAGEIPKFTGEPRK